MGKKSRQKWVNREERVEHSKNRYSRKKKIMKYSAIVIILAILVGVGGWQGYKYYNNNSVVEDPTMKDNQLAIINTNKGTIKFKLFASAAPKTVENFVKLAKDGKYDGVLFHRVIEDFMIQTGDLNAKGEAGKDFVYSDDPNPSGLPVAGTGDPGYKFADEINPWSLGLDEDTIKSLQNDGYKYTRDLISLKNIVGAVSMANSGPDTNGSQFFIITKEDQSYLDGKHTVFGQVIEGMDVVTAIRKGDIINAVTIESLEPVGPTASDTSASVTTDEGSFGIEATDSNGNPINIGITPVQ